MPDDYVVIKTEKNGVVVRTSKTVKCADVPHPKTFKQQVEDILIEKGLIV